MREEQTMTDEQIENMAKEITFTDLKAVYRQKRIDERKKNKKFFGNLLS